MSLVKAITADSQATPGRLYTKKRTSRTQLALAARKLVAGTGQTPRGPLTPVRVDNDKRFRDIYGEFDSTLGKVHVSLMEKELYPLIVQRACAAAAVAASKNLLDAAPATIATLTATSPGTWANALTYDITAASDGVANHWNLTVHDGGKDWLFENLDCTAGNNNFALVVGDDAATPIVLAKVADGRPINVTGATINTVAGTDGSIADTDFTGAGKTLETLAAHPEVKAVWIAERSNATCKAKMKTLADASSDRRFVICADASNTSVSSAVTDVATYRSERLIYAYNHGVIVNPITGVKQTVEPCSLRIALISQTDAWVHAGAFENSRLLGGLTDLAQPALADSDLDALVAAGISPLHKNAALPSGFGFFADVTTSIGGERQSTTIAIQDYLVGLGAVAVLPNLNQPNTLARREAHKLALEDISEREWKAGHGIDSWVDDAGVEDPTRGGYEVDIDSVNNATDRENNIERVLWRVCIGKFMTTLIMEHEMGRGVRFRRQQQIAA